MREFKNGDFIRLKDVNMHRIDQISGGEINIFEISTITPTHVEIYNCKEIILRSEIEAIPINGKDDFQIWYDPIIAAPICYSLESKPARIVAKSYYLKAFKRHTIDNNSNLYEKVIERNFKYVHEVQDFLRALFEKSDLVIDTYST